MVPHVAINFSTLGKEAVPPRVNQDVSVINAKLFRGTYKRFEMNYELNEIIPTDQPLFQSFQDNRDPLSYTWTRIEIIYNVSLFFFFSFLNQLPDFATSSKPVFSGYEWKIFHVRSSPSQNVDGNGRYHLGCAINWRSSTPWPIRKRGSASVRGESVIFPRTVLFSSRSFPIDELELRLRRRRRLSFLAFLFSGRTRVRLSRRRWPRRPLLLLRDRLPDQKSSDHHHGSPWRNLNDAASEHSFPMTSGQRRSSVPPRTRPPVPALLQRDEYVPKRACKDRYPWPVGTSTDIYTLRECNYAIVREFDWIVKANRELWSR